MIRILLLTLLAIPAASAGEVVLDVRLPSRVSLGGEILADLFQAAVLKVERPAGQVALVVSTQGEPERVVLQVPESGQIRALITHEGISSAALVAASDPEATGPMVLAVRTVGSSRLMLVVDGARHTVGPASPLEITLAPGDHALTVRSQDGAVVYSRGVLSVANGGEGVLQLVEGAGPQASGDGVSFVATGS